MKTIALVLSGCGVYDGSEIHEATLTAYFCDKQGLNISYLAPNIDQSGVINHHTGEPSNETRHCLTEASRIARGPVTALNDATLDNFDAAIFIGGYGAAKNLSNFATQGKDLSIQDDVARFILSMHELKKPLGFMCIAPVLVASLIPGVICTLGLEQENLDTLEKMGASFRQANYDDVVIDNTHLVYSTPAYMIDTSISKIAIGIEKLVGDISEAIPEKESTEEAVTA
ncbi:isoprenoid biosynthesis protein ElbB [Candidatus Marinamargulisbacteria bacterium SCGC AG-343-D04]|nr:isoprenoid biosynthesis protein ElbB [Candidatus Marinamargulisbacteria bacterium SCGC AG-343-D04]